jgi:hypothetical protein
MQLSGSLIISMKLGANLRFNAFAILFYIPQESNENFTFSIYYHTYFHDISLCGTGVTPTSSACALVMLLNNDGRI